MRERFVATTTSLLDSDPRVVVVLADISASALAAAHKRHPDRVVNVGIREQLMIGVAGGLALEGMRPVVHSYTPFLIERPFEQVKLDLGHQDVGAVLVSIGASYDASSVGRTHHAPEDVALLHTLDGWTIHVPGHPDEVDKLLRQAVRADDRVYLRLAESTNSAARSVGSGHFDVVRRGALGTVVAVGPMLDRTLEAVADLDVTVLYAATVRPFDGRTLVATLGEPAVVLVEPYLAGTSTSPAAQALRHVAHRILGLGVGQGDLRRYGTVADHDAAHGLDAVGLRRSITGFLRPARSGDCQE